MVLDGPINGLAFQAYVDQVLVAELRPGDVVVMDTLGSPQSPACARPSRRPARRCSISRPTVPTSIPIENAFAKLKALLRKAAERTVEGLWTKIGEPLPEFKPQPSAQITSPPQDTIRREWIRL